jgi:hypothetical protein
MADQKKRGFHAFEDRVHQIEEEEKQRESSSPDQASEAGDRGRPRPGGEKPPETRK